MCELLGINVSPPAAAGIFLKAFTPRAEHNSSGWGMGWYSHGRANLVKEPTRADHSPLAAQLSSDPPTSDVFVIHVRAATVGEMSQDNTHPFMADAAGRTWLFAHNGTIMEPETLETGGFSRRGQTDSEAAFYFLLSRIAAVDEQSQPEVLHRAALELSGRGKANFLLTDGSRLFAYYDGHKTLHHRVREHEEGVVQIADDDDYRIDLDASAPDDRMVVIASVPLDASAWTPMTPGEMLVCELGRITHRLTAVAS